MLTQVFEKADPARRALSETVLRNVRIIAIDQEIVQGGRSISAVVGKLAQTVSLELAPEQVKKVTVAKQLGTLSLGRTVSGRSVGYSGRSARCPAATCRRSLPARMHLPARATAVAIHSGGEVKQYSVRKQDADDIDADRSCDVSPEVARQHWRRPTGYAGKLPEKR